MIKTPFISIRGSDIIIAISHYPQDVLPAFFLKLMSPKSKLVVYHHGILIPPEHRSLIMSAIVRLVLIFLRYYGCPVCQMEMAKIKQEIDLVSKKGGRVFIVLQSAPETLASLTNKGD